MYLFHSDLVFLAPEVIQSDRFHCTVVTKSSPEHFLQHVNQVHVVRGVHGIVVVKVEEHHLHHTSKSNNTHFKYAYLRQ